MIYGKTPDASCTGSSFDISDCRFFSFALFDARLRLVVEGKQLLAVAVILALGDGFHRVDIRLCGSVVKRIFVGRFLYRYLNLPLFKAYLLELRLETLGSGLVVCLLGAL